MENSRTEGAGLVMLLTIAVSIVFTTVFTVTLFAANRPTSAPILAQDAAPMSSPAYAVISPTHTPPEWNVFAAQWQLGHEQADPGLSLTAETEYATAETPSFSL